MEFKKISLFIAIIFLSPILSSCADKVELEELGYVAAIGIDEGAKGMVRVTFQVTNPKAGGANLAAGGGGENENRSDTITVDAPGILVARDLASASITRRISLAHAKVIIAGEKFAKTERFFPMLESTLRDKEMRRSMTVMVSREDASDFIRNNVPVLEKRPQKFYEFMAKRWKDTGFAPPFSTMNRFMQRVESGGGLFLTTYGTSKDYVEKEGVTGLEFLPGQIRKEAVNLTEIIGAAVFRGGRMVGRMNGMEVRLTTLLRPRPEAKSMLFTFPDPLKKEDRIAGRIIKSKATKVKLNLEANPVKIDVTVPISIDILGISSFEDYPENLKKQEILKEAIVGYLRERSMELVRKSQKQWLGEPFLWETQVRKKFWTFDEFKQYDWAKYFESAEVSINYEVKLKSFGKQLNPPKKMQQKPNEETKGETAL